MYGRRSGRGPVVEQLADTVDVQLSLLGPPEDIPEDVEIIEDADAFHRTGPLWRG